MNRGQPDNDDSGQELVVLREVGTRVEADLVEALLRGAGIPCIVHPPSAHDLYSFLHAPGSAITIRVRAEDLERAQAVIAEQEPAPSEQDFCPYCGEYLGNAREACPRCGKDISEWVALGEEPAFAGPAPSGAPYAREHSTTWRFVVLLVLAAVAAMLLTPAGRRVGTALVRRAIEAAREVPLGVAAGGCYRESRATSAQADGKRPAAIAALRTSPGMKGQRPRASTFEIGPPTHTASQASPNR